MKLDVTSGGECHADVCSVPLGALFTLSVEIVDGPSGGYIGAQSAVDFGPHLTHNMAEQAVDEIVWPDCEEIVAVRDQFDAQTVYHGCLTGVVAPLPTSAHAGPFAELSFNCSPDPSSTFVRLLPVGNALVGNSGTGFALPDSSIVVPNVRGLTIHCGPGSEGGPAPTPIEPSDGTAAPTAVPPDDATATAIAGATATAATSDTTATPTEATDGTTNRDDGGGDGQGRTFVIVGVIIGVIVVSGAGIALYLRRRPQRRLL